MPQLQSDYSVNLNIVVNDKTSQPAKKAGRALDILKQAAVGVGVAFAAIKAAKVVTEFAKLGAAAQRQGQALDNLAVAAGTSGDAITKSIQEASGYTIDRMSAMSAASKAMVMDVAQSPEEFERLTKVAVSLGRAMGQDATKSIDDFVTASARQSQMIADNLGLTVTVGQATERYAAKLGIATDELTDAQKKQAFLNMMLEEGEAKMAALGDSTLDAAAEYEQIGAAWADAKTSLASITSTMLQATGVVQSFAQESRQAADGIERVSQAGGANLKLWWQAQVEGANAGESAAATTERYIALLETQASAFANTGERARQYNQALESMNVVASTHTTSMSSVAFVSEEVRASLDGQVTSQGMLMHTVLQASAAMDAAVPSMAAHAEATQGASMAQLDLSARLKDASDAMVAQAAIGQLKQALDKGEISFADYTTAVSETQLAFGLADEQSIFLTKSLGDLTTLLASGSLDAEDYDEALEGVIMQSHAAGVETNTFADALDGLPNFKRVDLEFRITQIGSTPGGGGGGEIPGFASGGQFLVGERGPELVTVQPLQNNVSQDTYNFNTAAAAATAMTRKRRRYISRLM